MYTATSKAKLFDTRQSEGPWEVTKIHRDPDAYTSTVNLLKGDMRVDIMLSTSRPDRPADERLWYDVEVADGQRYARFRMGAVKGSEEGGRLQYLPVDSAARPRMDSAEGKMWFTPRLLRKESESENGITVSFCDIQVQVVRGQALADGTVCPEFRVGDEVVSTDSYGLYLTLERRSKSPADGEARVLPELRGGRFRGSHGLSAFTHGNFEWEVIDPVNVKSLVLEGQTEGYHYIGMYEVANAEETRRFALVESFKPADGPWRIHVVDMADTKDELVRRNPNDSYMLMYRSDALNYVN